MVHTWIKFYTGKLGHGRRTSRPYVVFLWWSGAVRGSMYLN